MKRPIQFSLLLFIIGFFLFLPSLFNGFAYDDIRWVAYNKANHLNNLLFFFTSGIQARPGQASFFNFYYRPISFALFLTIRENTAFIFHLFQLTVFLGSVILVYNFFKKFFTATRSFFLALVFLVHPINQSLGAYVSTLQDTLCIFGGILALIFVNSRLGSVKRIFLSAVFFLFSLFSKEFGILFFPLLLLFAKFFSKNRIVVLALSLTTVTFVYLFLRDIAFNHPFATNLPLNPISGDLFERLTLIPIILFYFLIEISMPGTSVPRIKTILTQHPPDILIIGLLITLFLAVFAYGYFLKKHHSGFFKQYLFFICWTILGFLPYLQIIPLDALIARWWLSFSLFGVLGALGVIWSTFPMVSKRYSPIFRMFFWLYIFALAIGTIKANLALGEWWLHLTPP